LTFAKPTDFHPAIKAMRQHCVENTQASNPPMQLAAAGGAPDGLEGGKPVCLQILK
jgi:hypothetical protein